MGQYGIEPQIVITYPLLVGTDGTEKMSKSRGNTIGITDAPDEMFGKTMSIPDSALSQWWELLIGQALPEAHEPMAAKLDLARRIVTRWHGKEAAASADAHFTRVVREGGAPAEVPETTLPDGDPVHLPALLATAFGLSTSEARRMIGQGAVKLNGHPAAELDVARASVAGALLQAGKRRFVRYRADA